VLALLEEGKSIRSILLRGEATYKDASTLREIQKTEKIYFCKDILRKTSAISHFNQLEQY
jgi:hypothetical protein